MSAPASPPPIPAPVKSAQPAGCLPFSVFLLTVFVAVGFFMLHKGWLLPKEPAGSTVVEIMGSPTREQMKDHLKRLMSPEVLRSAAASINVATVSPQNVDASARGPFITIAAFADYDRKAAIALAGAVARAYDEDLQRQYEGVQRRTNQAIEAFTNIAVGQTETARLNWMEVMKKNQLSPDGRSSADEAAVQEINSRLAKARADFISVSQLADVFKERDIDKVALALLASPSAEAGLKNKCQTYFEWKATAAAPGATPDAEASAKSTRERLTPVIDFHRTQSEAQLAALRNQISGYETALKNLENEAFSRLNRRSEMDSAKATYDSNKAQLQRLKEEALERRVKDSVVQMHTRAIEPPHGVDAPHPDVRRTLRHAIAGAAVLLVALLLSALASRLCRRV